MPGPRQDYPNKPPISAGSRVTSQPGVPSVRSADGLWEWDGLAWRPVSRPDTSTHNKQAAAADGSKSIPLRAAVLGQAAGLLIGAALLIWSLGDLSNRTWAFGAGIGVMFVPIQQIIVAMRANRRR